MAEHITHDEMVAALNAASWTINPYDATGVEWAYRRLVLSQNPS